MKKFKVQSPGRRRISRAKLGKIMPPHFCLELSESPEARYVERDCHQLFQRIVYGWHEAGIMPPCVFYVAGHARAASIRPTREKYSMTTDVLPAAAPTYTFIEEAICAKKSCAIFEGLA